MSEEKVKLIIKVVSDALGEHVKLFDIKKSEILNEEENYFSMTVCISPKKDINLLDDNVVTGGDCFLQFDVDNDEINLMTGEDCDYGLDVTFGNIYSQLYWCEAVQVI